MMIVSHPAYYSIVFWINMEKSHDAERRCAEQIIRMIENHCHYKINEDEKMYLMIHLIRLNNSRDQNRH